MKKEIVIESILNACVFALCLLFAIGVAVTAVQVAQGNVGGTTHFAF